MVCDVFKYQNRKETLNRSFIYAVKYAVKDVGCFNGWEVTSIYSCLNINIIKICLCYKGLLVAWRQRTKTSKPVQASSSNKQTAYLATDVQKHNSHATGKNIVHSNCWRDL